jgi:uncharacterized protein with NRDE domain
MCTVVILCRPGHDWPLLIAANRDEMKDRPWSAPARHWPERPEVLAGRDDLAGGSWMGINDHGVVACVLNRRGTLGPAKGKRSRGELVLECLDHADASIAALALSELRPQSYRPFNMVVADHRDAFFVAHRAETAEVEVRRLPEGLTMLTAREPNDSASPRIARNRALFEKAAVPDPAAGDWRDWEALLASRAGGEVVPEAAMCFELPSGFATVSSACVALPAPNLAGIRPVFRFAAGPPDRAAFRPLVMQI